MIDRRPSRYEWGQAVVAAVDLYNDGSHPEAAEDQLLVVAGGPGEIVQVGHHAEANVPVYMVDFGIAVIGCLEEEIATEGADFSALPRAGSELMA